MFTSIKTKSSKQYIQPPHLYDTPKMRKIMKGVGVRLYKQGKKTLASLSKVSSGNTYRLPITRVGVHSQSLI